MIKSILRCFAYGILFLACQSTDKKNIWQTGEPLFPIVRDDRWGFINRDGEEVIKPVFRGVGLFVDSLAPARLNGTWGYINPQGIFVIPAIYDGALEFSEGYAKVWKQGKMDFINQNGQSQGFALPDSILKIEDFIGGQVKFEARKSGRWCNFILKNNGEILPDKSLSEGLAIVTREVSDYEKTQYAVYDSLGNMIVPFGRYDGIKPFHAGFAEVSFPRDNRTGFINRTGELVFMLPKGSYVFENSYSEGLLAVYARFEPESNIYSYEDHYTTWYDTTGRCVLVKKEDRSVYDFKNGRSFAGSIRDMYLMDKNGNQVGSNRFKSVLDNDFSDNMAIVAVAGNDDFPVIDLHGAIDSMGNYTIQPQFNEVHETQFQKEGMLVAMNEPLRAAHYAPEFQRIKKYWGLIDRKGHWIFSPKLTQVSPEGFKNGLLYAEIDSLYGYVNPTGKFVWSAIRVKEPVHPEPLNVDFMLRAFCYGYQSGNTTVKDSTINLAQSGAKAKGFLQNELGIFVNVNEEVRFFKKYSGLAAYVFNTGADTLKIDVQDNRLYIVAQALNAQGEWHNIEYCPSSWCGNSYYDIRLNPDEYWKFEIPVYDGDFPTTLRLAFTYQRSYTKKGDEPITIYSNTYSGKVNPAQFWKEQGYSPGGLMDPYNN